MAKKKTHTDALKELIDTSIDVTGSAAGTGLGLLLAGPGGALLGAAAGPVITSVVKLMAVEIKTRIIGNREEVRIGAALTYALIKIEEKFKEGNEINSKYLDDNLHNQTRSTAKETLEGILLTAQREYEEKKLKYIGNLYGNVLFKEYNRAFIISLIRMIEPLSYRQLVIIKVIGDIDKYDLKKPISAPTFDIRKLNSENTQANLDYRIVDDDIMAELNDLKNKMIVKHRGGNPENLYYKDILTNLGKTLYDLMELDSIPDVEAVACSNQMRGMVI